MSYNSRIAKLKVQLTTLNLDGMYITNLTNVRYLTGFSGSAGSLLVLEDEQHFFTDGRYIEQSHSQVKNSKIHIVGSAHYQEIKKESLIPDNLSIAIEANFVSIGLYDQIQAALPQVSWEKVHDIIGIIAAVKDLGEIESLKTAIEITDEVFTKIIPELKIGATEKNIAAKISYLFKMHGAEGDSYESIIAGGPRSALPHARPTDREFQKGDFIVMDFGALYNGYHADMTRTLLVGTTTERHKEIYNIVLETQLNGIAIAKAGIPCSDVDFACRSIIDKAGYADLFNHSTGHGIGLEVHTLPRIHKNNNEPLKQNNVITIEPGIYIPNWGGVRIEDDCLIQKNTCTPPTGRTTFNNGA